MKLEPNAVVELAHDRTLVFVEELTELFASVVALPDQLPARTPLPAFEPGSVRAKKISPLSAIVRTVPRDELSDDNQRFLDHYRDLRETHGKRYNVLGPPQSVPPAAEDGPETKRPVTRARSSTPTSSSSGRYRLCSSDLKAAAKADDRYKDGRRGHRVVQALASLPDQTGSVEDILLALVRDGGGVPADPEKLVRRTLKQLQSEVFGSLVQAI